MEFNLEALIPIVLAILFIVFGGTRKRKQTQRPAQTPQTAESNTIEVDTANDSDVVFPPFMDNFEGVPTETEVSQHSQTIDEDMNGQMVTEQSESVPEPTPERKPIETPPVPVDSPTRLPSRPLPVTSLIELNPDTFRQGIILAEILGRPKTFRNRRR
ncbi:hypothetical protein F4X73_14630 [Candidatus Poribacteria bacterium]|nr:hypothetical protein [Candidatus Poribacteria bacterium]MYB65923.1 hypothetical protein [Candidatus Poribacteria bacterium]MYF56206.1 hypothetical protein [Candidatus Poribacteria bacterium]